ITVTARMREESLQETPVSVTAVTGDQIVKMFVRDLTDFTRVAPNFTIEGVGAIHRNAAVVYSRGIGYQGVDQAIDPSVGIAVDGVFYTRNIGALQGAFDVAQIEVLRGPQGTLFGKNTTGGVVSVTTKEPGDHYDFQAMARAGNFGRADFAFAADMPASPTLSFRISGASQYSDGYIRNTYTNAQGLQPNKWLGGDNVKSLRASVKWTPTDNLKFVLTGAIIRDRSQSVGGINASYPTDYLSVLLGHPGYGFPGGPTDPFTTQRNFPSGDYADTKSLTLNARYEGHGFRIVSITGYMHDKNFSYNDFDDSGLSFFETTSTQDHDQFSQEIRLESANNSPLQWVAGGYYSHVVWSAGQIFYLSSVSEEGSHQSGDAGAVFAQVDYKITPRLNITLGGRYSTEKKDFTRYFQVPIATYPTPPALSNKAWSNFTYHAGVNYKVTDDVMVYGSYSTGFKSGGYNSRAATALAIGPFNPEKARAWEGGIKSEWFDHRVRLDVAGFWNNYTDLQIGVFKPASNGSGEQQVVANDANERARGFEAELTAVPTPGLNITGSVGYLDAVYTSFVTDLTGKPKSASNPCGGVVDRSDPTNTACYLVPTRVPKWTTRLEASYEFDLNGHGKLTPVASWSLESSHFTDTTNAPQGYQPTYSIFDASLNYDDPTGRWRASLWAKNLGNVAHKLSAVPTAGLLTQLYFAQPRTFGVELRVKLGD
ncbi:MAG TPA: TonB-dependent receptor, partial [Caulobacteraceae bacterium]|nr:TonB-dependent receptor [Caulobacteraceae bacterium]